ncbi:MAG: MaoC/PaaZ C-terminal domain-containing protein [Acidimicrobiia bacterium]
MPLDPTAVPAIGEPTEATWTSKDTLLYAVGVGAGMSELPFVTENSIDVAQQVLPTYCVVIPGGSAMGKVGSFNLAALVHGGQRIELFRPIPPAGTVIAQSSVPAMYDKGKAAIVVMRNEYRLKDTGELLATSESQAFIRGEGGWGGDRGPSGNKHERPERAPDHTVVYQTSPDQALVYRLSGDRNPLHSDPQFAKLAGFETPILHGLCTFGFTGRALLHSLCASDPAKFKSMDVRFSQPVYPGEQLTVKMWVLEPGLCYFNTESPRGVVIDDGEFTYAA